jgi:hypothetical protein
MGQVIPLADALAVSIGIVAAIMALPVHPQQRVDRSHPWPYCFENV